MPAHKPATTVLRQLTHSNMPRAAGLAVALWADVHGQLACLTLGPVQLPGMALAESLSHHSSPAHMLSFWLPGGGVQPLPSHQGQLYPEYLLTVQPCSYGICAS